MPDRALADIARRFWSFQRHEYPIAAILAGEPLEEPVLLREAPADHERRAAWAKAALEELGGVDPEIDHEDRITRSLLARELDLLVEAVASGAVWRPTLHPIGPEFALQSWAGSTVIDGEAAARAYLDRAAAIPEALAGVRQSILIGIERGYRYPRLVVDRAVAQLRAGMASEQGAQLFAAPLARAAERSPALAALAEEGRALAAGVVLPAFRSHAAFLEGEVARAARESIGCSQDPDGDRLYRFAVRQATTLDLGPGEIHAFGLAEVERIEAEMLELVGEDLGGFREKLAADPAQRAPDGESLRIEIESLAKRIDALVPEYFGRLPRMTYGIRSIPAAISDKMPPAYAQPNPADRSAAGLFWVSGNPAKCPRYLHAALTLHEAWPGHLMHVALVQELDHLPAFRRHGALRYSALLEGWALHCESLGHEMGLYDTTEKKYGVLEMEMWRALRLVVDSGIHSGGWSRERAIDYFERHLAMQRGTIEAEVDRYIGWPGQALAYQLGGDRLRRIRARAERVLGDRFRLRRFHDAVMAAGPVTLPVLEEIVSRWTACELAQLRAQQEGSREGSGPSPD